MPSQLRGAAFPSPPPKNSSAHIKHEGQVNKCGFGLYELNPPAVFQAPKSLQHHYKNIRFSLAA